MSPSMMMLWGMTLGLGLLVIIVGQLMKRSENKRDRNN